MTDQVVSILAKLKDQLSGPLGTVAQRIGSVTRSAQALGTHLSPLVSGVSGLVAAFAGFSSVRETIELAREDVQAQQRVLSALKGRRSELERIVDLAGKVQESSEIGDEVLLNQVASLLRMGVAARDVDKALQAAVDTSVAFGLPMESVVRSIGMFQSNQAGRLTMFIPQLRKIQEEGRLATDGLDALMEVAGGAAADQASTSFGEITKQINRLSDIGERIGVHFARIWLGILKAVQPVVEEFERLSASTGIQVLIELLIQALPLVVKIASAATTLFAAAIAFKAAVFLGPVITGLVSILAGIVGIAAAIGGVLLTKVGLVLVVIGSVIALVAKLTGVWDEFVKLLDSASTIFGDQMSQFGELLGMVKDGKLSIGVLFDFIQTRIRQAWTLFKAFIVDPIYLFFRSWFRMVKAIWNGVINILMSTAIRVADAYQTAFLTVIRFITSQVDSIVNTLNSALEAIDEAAGTNLSFGKSNLSGLIPNELIALSGIADELDKQTLDNVDTLLNTIPDAVIQATNGMVNAIHEVTAESKDLNDRIATDVEANAKKAASAIEEQLKKTLLNNARLLAEIASGSEEFQNSSRLGISVAGINPAAARKLLNDSAFALQEPLRAALKAEFDEQLRQSTISTEEYFSLVEEIETSFLQKQISQFETLVAQKKELLEATKAELVESDGTLETEEKRNDVLGRISEATRALVDLDVQRQQLVIQLIAKEQGLTKIRLSTAQGINSLLNEEKETYDDITRVITTQMQAGLVGIQNGMDGVSRSTSDFGRKIDIARAKIQALLSSGVSPLRKDILDLMKQLNKLVELQDSKTIAAANAVLARVEAARTRMSTEIGRAESEFQGGAITASERDTRKQSAIDSFSSEFRDAEQALAGVSVSTGEATASLSDLRLKFSDMKTELVTELAPETGSFLTNFQSGAEGVIEQMSDLNALSSDVGQTFAQDLGQGLMIAFTQGKEAFSAFAKEFLVKIAQMILQALIYKAIASSFGLGGAPTVGLNSGGLVPGPNVNRDVVNAKLTPGEFVSDRATVSYYGAAFFHGLKRRMLGPMRPSGGSVVSLGSKGFNEGGLVPFNGGGRPTPATVVASDQEMERLLGGGAGAMERYFRDNRSTVRSILGVT